MTPLKNFLLGSTSIGSIQLLEIIPTDPESLMIIAKLLGQVAVALFTCIGIFKSWKKKNE